MKEVYIQLWEIFLVDKSIQSDGCSLHISLSSRNNFLQNLERNIIERPVGKQETVYVDDSIYQILKVESDIRLSEVEFNNSLNLKRIKVYDSV
jgi:hypothetical protein